MLECIFLGVTVCISEAKKEEVGLYCDTEILLHPPQHKKGLRRDGG